MARASANHETLIRPIRYQKRIADTKHRYFFASIGIPSVTEVATMQALLNVMGVGALVVLLWTRPRR